MTDEHEPPVTVTIIGAILLVVALVTIDSVRVLWNRFKGKSDDGA